MLNSAGFLPKASQCILGLSADSLSPATDPAQKTQSLSLYLSYSLLTRR